jgi:hypothetical protein
MHYIEVLEDCLGRKAQKNFLPPQLGDVPDKFADIGSAGGRRTRIRCLQFSYRCLH